MRSAAAQHPLPVLHVLAAWRTLERVRRLVRAPRRQAEWRAALECAVLLGLLVSALLIICALTWQGLADRELALAQQTRGSDVDLTARIVAEDGSRRSALVAERGSTTVVTAPPTPARPQVSRPSSTISGTPVALALIGATLAAGGLLGRRIVARFRDLATRLATRLNAGDPAEVPPADLGGESATVEEVSAEATGPAIPATVSDPSESVPIQPDALRADDAETDLLADGGQWLGLLDDSEREDTDSTGAMPGMATQRVLLFVRDDVPQRATAQDPVTFRASAHLQWDGHAMKCTTTQLGKHRITCELPTRRPTAIAPAPGADVRLRVVLNAQIVSLRCAVDAVRIRDGSHEVELRVGEVRAAYRSLLRDAAKSMSSLDDAGGERKVG